MKIKHWQGYGTVNAKKLSSSADVLVVEVWGNHEWGIARNDVYDVCNWLVTKFDKVHDSSNVEGISLKSFYSKEGHTEVEHCIYTIYFKPGT